MLSKTAVHYSIGMVHSHCGKVYSDDKGYCAHFLIGKTVASSSAIAGVHQGTCELVDGSIDPVYWCQKFKKAVS